MKTIPVYASLNVILAITPATYVIITVDFHKMGIMMTHNEIFKDLCLCLQLWIYSIFPGSSPCINFPKILSYDLHVSYPHPGRPCQRWDSQTPTSHPYTDPDMFPHDATIAEAANYCRNPDGGPLPWCYVTAANEPWMYCSTSILNCGKIISSIITPAGTDTLKLPFHTDLLYVWTISFWSSNV